MNIENPQAVAAKNTTLTVLFTITNNIMVWYIKPNHKPKLLRKAILIHNICMLYTVRDFTLAKKILTVPFFFNVFILKHFVQVVSIDLQSMLQNANMWRVHLGKSILIFHILILILNPPLSNNVIEYIARIKQTTSGIDSL